MREDIKYAIRMLAKSPAFTAVAVLSLALGVGANTAVFTLTNAAFLTSLHVQDLPRLMQVWGVERASGGSNASGLSFPNYEDLRDRNDVFSGVAAYTGGMVTMKTRGAPRRIYTIPATANYFDVLSVKMALGRSLLPEDDRMAAPVVVLCDDLWRSDFGSDPQIVGKTVELNSTPFTIIGVAPPGFRSTFDIYPPNLVYVPLNAHVRMLQGSEQAGSGDRGMPPVFVFGRLKPGVSRRQALANVQTIAAQLERENPDANRGRSMDVVPLSEAALPVKSFVRSVWLLTAGAALVLLIACVNLANLLLARSAKRAREMGIRAALGAGRIRIVGHVLIESLLLATAGGLAGLFAGWFGSRLLWSLRPPLLDGNSISISLDSHVLTFTASAALLTVILFGLFPAIQASTADLNSILKSGGRGTDRLGNRWRGLLVVSQVALSMVALIGAGLFIRSMQRAEAANPGFETRNLILFTFDLASQRYSVERGKSFMRGAVEQAEGTPGIHSAALTSAPPFKRIEVRRVTPEEQENATGNELVLTTVNAISPRYFEVMRISLLKGRALTDLDRDGTQPVAVVSLSFARRFWPGQDGIGRRFKLENENFDREVVGIVDDVTPVRAGYPPRPIAAYLPLTQSYHPLLSLVGRTAVDPALALKPVLSNVQTLDSNLAPADAQTMPELVAQGMYGPRAGAALFSILGLLGLALAIMGIYGVMAYMVAQRTNEIGIRMALGARPANILQLVVGQAARLTIGGIALGVAAALALSRWIAALLFGVGGQDLLTFCVVSLAVGGAALIAAWVPARRAARIDPLRALHDN